MLLYFLNKWHFFCGLCIQNYCRMKLYFTTPLVLGVFLCSIISTYSQSTLRLKKGVVVDSLTVPASEGVFSIYVPTSFEINKKYPILFGFDSSNKSSLFTSLFSTSAEEQQYIVAISDYAGKLSVKDKSIYVALFMKHIAALFPIQNNRIYVLGVGKDAVFNSSLPMLYPTINGVIAIGDSAHLNKKINANKRFSHIGIVDDKNFRYQRFLDTHKYLKRKKKASELYVYNGNKEFPPENIITNALSYLTLDAMQTGKIQTDSLWIADRYKKDKEIVKLLKEQNKYVQVYDELDRIRTRYSKFFKIDTLKEAQKEIRKIKSFKKEKRLKSKYHNQEIYLREAYSWSLEEDVALNQYDNLGWWQYKMNALDELRNGNEKYASNMAYRVKGFLQHRLSGYKKEASAQQNELNKEIFLNILSTIVDKQDFQSYKRIISLSAMDQDDETAIFYLEKMLQNGYKEMGELYTIEGTLSLRISKAYNRMIKKYLGTSKYFSFD